MAYGTRCHPNGTYHYWPAVTCCPRWVTLHSGVLQTTTDDRRRRWQTPTNKTIVPPTICVGGPVIPQYTNRRLRRFAPLYIMVIFAQLRVTIWSIKLNNIRQRTLQQLVAYGVKWCALPQCLIDRSINECRRRLQCVMDQKGGHIEHVSLSCKIILVRDATL